MNPPNQPDYFPSDEALDDEATAWLCERDEGFSPARARAFAVWRAADPRHASAVTRVEATLALLAEMPAVRAPLAARLAQAEPAPRVAEEGRGRRFSFPTWATGLAAALVIGVSVAVWWSNSPRAPAGERYTTAAAAQRRVALSDGTVVDLNAGSELHVTFTATERRVTLGAGEAHFQVASNPARPFIVTADGVSVRAVGTAFNVRLASTAVDVLVTEGRVEVGRTTPASAVATSLVTGVAPAARPLVAAGERASISRDPTATPGAPKVEKIAAAAIRTALAWQDRITSFTDVPLRELVARFNRRNATQLVLADEELGQRKVGGMIALDQVEAFVRLLEQEGDVVAERPGPHEIRLRRAR